MPLISASFPAARRENPDTPPIHMMNTSAFSLRPFSLQYSIWKKITVKVIKSTEV
jgi:hypothetical protein